MPKVIIADTSCFILLTNIGEFDLLREVYGQIITTIDIAIEFGDPLPDWVIIETVSDLQKQQLLEMQLDKGESSAIALALEISESTVILDDYKARRIADQLHVSYTGTLGVIVKAKLKGIIKSVRPLLAKIKQTDFRITDDLERLVLKEAGE